MAPSLKAEASNKENVNFEGVDDTEKLKSIDLMDMSSLASEITQGDLQNGEAANNLKIVEGALKPQNSTKINQNYFQTPKAPSAGTRANIKNFEFTPILHTVKKQSKPYVSSPLSKVVSPSKSASSNSQSSIHDPAFQSENDLSKTVKSISLDGNTNSLDTPMMTNGHTVKHEENILNQLANENFNLKLRVHFLNKLALQNGMDKDDDRFKMVDFEVIKGNLLKDAKNYRIALLEAKKELMELKKSESSKLEKKDSEIALLKAENEAVKAKLDLANEEVTSLKNGAPLATANLEELSEKEDLKAEIRRLTDQVDQYEEDIQNYKREHTDAHRLGDEDIRILQEELDDSNLKLKEAEAKVIELDNVINDYELELEKVCKQNDQLHYELENLNSLKAETEFKFNQKLEQLEREKKDLENELESYKKSNDSESLKNRISSIEAERDQYKAELKWLKDEANTSPSPIDNSRTSLRYASQRNMQNSERIKELELAKLDLEGQLRRTAQENKQLMLQIDDLNYHYDNNSKLIEKLKSELQDSTSQTAYQDALENIRVLKDQLYRREGTNSRVYDELLELHRVNRKLNRLNLQQQQLLSQKDSNSPPQHYYDDNQKVMQLKYQVDHLRAIAIRERAYRMDLIFCKTYFLKMLQNYEASSGIGIDLMQEIGIKSEAKLWRRRKSLRPIVYLVVAVIRLQARQRSN